MPLVKCGVDGRPGFLIFLTALPKEVPAQYVPTLFCRGMRTDKVEPAWRDPGLSGPVPGVAQPSLSGKARNGADSAISPSRAEAIILWR